MVWGNSCKLIQICLLLFFSEGKAEERIVGYKESGYKQQSIFLYEKSFLICFPID